MSGTVTKKQGGYDNAWESFTKGPWIEQVDVRNFIQLNYTPYDGGEEFLAPIAPSTKEMWDEVNALMIDLTSKGKVLADTTRFSGINNHPAGYINKDLEKIVGLQTDEVMKRIVNPYGGYRMVQTSLAAYDLKVDETLEKHFQEFRKTHNAGVFDAYTNDMRAARSVGLLTGLPDAYGRGRIIGDYRRVALYGLDFLIKEKQNDFNALNALPALEDTIRDREEISEQYRALNELKALGERYGLELGRPAETAQEAIQWLYMAYLAAVKQNNGAAMSLGRNAGFLDIYIKRDMDKGILDEMGAQELVDHFVMKLRVMRHLRTPEYDDLFGGDPTWVTESIGGVGVDGRHLVTKTAFRILHTLENMDSSPEPNMTVLWSQDLPVGFKDYCSKLSIETGSLQYENDDLMKPIYGDDYAIACCVSPMTIGKQMQFFGARANLAKGLLYAINRGFDEKKKTKAGEPFRVLHDVKSVEDGVLDFDAVWENYKDVMSKLAKLYVDTMNTIHYMHDKYAYESVQMALHDSYNLGRIMAFGIAGISIVADSLSAIKFAKVTPIRDENGIAVDFETVGDFPKFGNDDDRVDQLAIAVTEFFASELKKHKTYRDGEHTLSLLTITSNVVYGKKTGATPDGRKAGEPFAPGANPMHSRDNTGALASLNSVAKLPFKAVCQDGISNTFSIVPSTIGQDLGQRIVNLRTILDGYFARNAFHLNVNVLDRSILQDALENPEKYQNLTIRVSGYAVRFNSLNREQKLEVIKRTFHESC